MRILLPAVSLSLLFAACGNPSKNTGSSAPKAERTGDSLVRPKDTHTLSNADSVRMQHLSLDIAVSFEKKQISGRADWTIDNAAKASELHLDDYALKIDSIAVDGRKTTFSLAAPVQFLGSRLSIPIRPESRKVSIWYATTDSARALQWLTPQQTMSKTHPFLYTQSESIYARSWVPCADGPGIRFTYDARVTVPKGLMALMSAENPQMVSDSGIYHFRMENPIPAYLMALAVGDIAFRSIDQRTGVYAEPAMIDKARYELEDVGKMVTTAESLYGPYRWGRYDVLVLPPGFPIGGMENPKLTFCTPTIIAGDRSLVNLIAHELAHNWSGNLVTNATWNDIWMNEGFTVYFERRITEAMMGKSYVDMLWELGYQDLEEEVRNFGKDSLHDTYLKLHLEGRDPDEGLSNIPYEKGSLFLWLIERNVGREKFDAFLKEYFSSHAFKTVTTEEFLDYLRANLIKGDKALEEKLSINAWVYGPGIPANCPRADRKRFNQVDTVRKIYLGAIGDVPADAYTLHWTSNEWQYFLRGMPDTLNAKWMQWFDLSFKFTQTGNSEIAELWFLMAIRAKYKPAYPKLEAFLSHVGRQKFLLPLYQCLIKTGQQKMAHGWYSKYRRNYHPLTQAKLDKIVRE